MVLAVRAVRVGRRTFGRVAWGTGGREDGRLADGVEGLGMDGETYLPALISRRGGSHDEVLGVVAVLW